MRVPLRLALAFTYRAELGRGISEHELDLVFVGVSDAAPTINRDEVSEVRYVAVDALRREMAARPDEFTPWCRLLLDDVVTNHAAHSAVPTGR
jgi:isopentenyl-diphosphate delta-isomerase